MMRFRLPSARIPRCLSKRSHPKRISRLSILAVPSGSVRILGKYDMAMYDAAGELTSYSRQVNYGSSSIGAGNRFAIMNSDTKSMEVYGPYDVFKVTDRITPVTFQQTLLPGESSEYQNKAYRLILYYSDWSI